MCAGDRKTLVTDLTAEERLFLVHRDHPPENETRQDPSRSNVLWLPGDTIESAAVNGNPLVTQGSRDHSETSQLLTSLKQPVPPEELPTPCQAIAGLGWSGDHLIPNTCRHLLALSR